MAPNKKAVVTFKLELAGGQATPAPPVVPPSATRRQHHGVLQGLQRGHRIPAGEVLPAEITVYEDRSFTFVLKTPPAAKLLLKAAGVAKGSGEPHRVKVGKVTQAQVREIAEKKLPDLNANDLDAASLIVAGTARSMGIKASKDRLEADHNLRKL